MYLSKEAIFAADDRPTEVVDIPEWGGKVIVKAISGTDRDRFEQSIANPKGGVKDGAVIRARLVSLAVVDEKGAKIFEPRDMEDLGKKSAAVLDRLYDVAARISGISKAGQEQAEKN